MTLITADDFRTAEVDRGRTLYAMHDQTGAKQSAALRKAGARLMEAGAGNANAARLATEAETYLEEVTRREDQAAALAIVEGYGKGIALVDQTIAPSEIPAATEALAAARRVKKLAAIALKTAQFEYAEEMHRPKVLTDLAELWAETTGWEPGPRTTAFEARDRIAASVPQLDAIAALVWALAKGENPTKGESDKLRKALAARPAEMPTLASATAEVVTDREATPHAQAARRLEEHKAAQSKQASESATAAAQARKGGD